MNAPAAELAEWWETLPPSAQRRVKTIMDLASFECMYRVQLAAIDAEVNTMQSFPEAEQLLARFSAK